MASSVESKDAESAAAANPALTQRYKAAPSASFNLKNVIFKLRTLSYNFLLIVDFVPKTHSYPWSPLKIPILPLFPNLQGSSFCILQSEECDLQATYVILQFSLDRRLCS